MANIIDYLKWRGDISFKENKFNEVDNLILSELSYMDIPKYSKNITINKAIDNFLNTFSEKEINKKFPLNRNPIPFFKALKESNRFCNLKIINYQKITSEIEEQQFCAMTFKLNFNTVYIAYRGTDASLVGWKEDLNMSFKNVPSQLQALKYLSNTKIWYRNIILGGHSKGGNLAVFAGVSKRSFKNRIKAIYNNDGPGFLKDFVDNPLYQDMIPKINFLIPETSIVGMILFHKASYKVIKSDTRLIWQHDPLSWQVDNTGFITLESVDKTSENINNIISNWLSNLNAIQREQFVNNLYKILKTNNINTIEELAKLKITKIPSLLKTFYKLDKESQKNIMLVLETLISEAKKIYNYRDIFNPLKMFSIKKM